MNKKIAISGWFKYGHSISLVNLEHTKCLLDMSYDIYGTERSPLFSNWIFKNGNYPLLDDLYYKNIVDQYKTTIATLEYDAYIDIAVPPALMPYRAKRNAVFMVSELDQLSPTYIKFAGGFSSLRRIHDQCNFIFTPSEWSRQSILNTGLDQNNVFVVPHGIQPLDLSSDTRKSIKKQLRDKLKITQEKIVILHVGAMTDNKGIDVLIKAISLSNYSKKICLLMKGNDSLFSSNKIVNRVLKFCADQGLSLPEIKYIGNNLSKNSLTHLFLSCDLYASLFRSEGFNLPVAEAINLDIPVLVSQAPPVTEYLQDSKKAYYVQAKSILNPSTNKIMHFEPDLESAVEQVNRFCQSHDISNENKHKSTLITWYKSTQILCNHLGLI
tara:strand:- start:733 stop:1881 length:1149 start_codon:yes stop_codon:yes gene_type:complete